MVEERLNLLSREIIGACIEVHKALGPGLLESVYLECLCLELRHSGIQYQRETKIPIKYRGSVVDTILRADLVVEEEIIVELKAVNEIMPIHEAQILSYLKLLDKQLGLLINFNVPLLKEGIKRVINPTFSNKQVNRSSNPPQ